MIGNGQYIYIHVVPINTEITEETEPMFKFNNGFHGGSPGVLFDHQYQSHVSGLMAGLSEAVVEPAVDLLLTPEEPEA